MNRTGHCWTRCVCRNPTPTRFTFAFTPLPGLGKHSIGVRLGCKINRQDMVFIRPPGISDGAFQLKMNSIWFRKLLLLFKIDLKTGMIKHECAYVSVLQECKCHRKPGHIFQIRRILHYAHVIHCSTLVGSARSGRSPVVQPIVQPIVHIVHILSYFCFIIV